MFTGLTVTFQSTPSPRVTIVFGADWIEKSTIGTVSAIAGVLFPGASIQIEQVDDLTWIVTR